MIRRSENGRRSQAVADHAHHLSFSKRLVLPARDEASALARPSVSLKLLWWLTCGVAGSVLFPVIYLIEGVTRPGYNAWEQTISALSHGPAGWIQQLNFVLCGVSILWMAFVWRKLLGGGVCARLYPALRALEGCGLIGVAIFSEDPLHTVFLVVIVEAMTFGLVVIARRFWKQPNWRGWVVFSIACGLLPMVLMPVFGVALHSQSVFTAYAGLFERLATNADTIWSLALIVHLWRHRKTSI